MYTLVPRLAPVLVLAVMLGGFMTLDKLWLHWYTPDASNFVLERRPDQALPTATAHSLTPVPSPGSSEAQTATADLSVRTRNAFAALWVVSQQTPYKARYEASSESGAKGNSYVIFNKPPLGRIDTFPPGATEPSSQLFADAAGATSRCSSADGTRQCVPIERFAAPFAFTAGPIVFPPATTFGSYDVTELDRRALAGASARCFHLAPTTTAGSGTDADYCFSLTDPPVLVYGRGTFGTVEASDVSPAVSDGDFVASAQGPVGTAPGVTFTSVVTASPGGSASVTVQTTPGSACSIEYITPAGVPSTDQGLFDKRADSSGGVSWSWRIGSRSSPGIATVRVSCDGVQASANIAIG